MNKFQKVNHFPRSMEICRKDLMTINIKRVMKRAPEDFDFFPVSFVLPDEIDFALENMRENPKEWYILKPSSAA
jgi:hypothetical protein